jgi:hypothetical protein
MSAAPEEKVGAARSEELSEERSEESALPTVEDSSETVLRSEEQELYDFGQVQCAVVYSVDCAGGVAAWYRVQVPEHWPVSSSAECVRSLQLVHILVIISLYSYAS